MKYNSEPTNPVSQTSPSVPSPHQELQQPMRSLLIGMIWLTISTTVALHFGALIVVTCIQDWWIKPIGLSDSDTTPPSVEHLTAAWISLIAAILSCMLLQAYDDRLTRLRAADQSSAQTGTSDGSTTS